MAQDQVKKIISDQLKKRDEHVFLEHLSDDYRNLFLEYISALSQKEVLASDKAINRLCNKLQLCDSYNRDKCFQGISEIIFWIYAIRMNYDFEIDKKLHTKNEKNNSDVDIQISKNGHRFNIEVKTPTQTQKSDESIINVNMPFRFSKSKNAQDRIMENINCEVVKKIIDNSNGQFVASEQHKNNDNKVIEYLRSGQTKFTYDSNSINILALSIPSQEMNDYWGYLYNPYTGIFTEGFEGIFLDKNNEPIKHSDFDKVDVIYLTNIVEGHIRSIKDFDSWKLENYCSIFCFNPFSQRIKNKSDIEVCRELNEILPNDTFQFEKEHEERNKKGAKIGIPTDPIFFTEYLYDHYPQLK